MFIDSAKIYIKAGSGGNGMVSFHTEKYVPNGGPDGGNGGRGGDVVFFADEGLGTLQDFRYKRKYLAENGDQGGRRRKAGKSGEVLRIRVPVGTLIKDAESGRVLADLTEDGQEAVVAKGGRGGAGNVSFKNSIRQAPNFARAGEPGEAFNLQIELKLLADVGLVGFPNVGKSTLLSMVSAAHPKIADYPFTTLEPQLGVVGINDASFVIADIPGLIEGAHEGQGLGIDFLRHIERTRLIIHVLDASGHAGRDPLEDFEQINSELSAFSELLGTRPQIVALNMIDMAEPGDLDQLQKTLEDSGYKVFRICAPINEGLSDLIKYTAEQVSKLPKTVLIDPIEETVLYTYEAEDLFEIDHSDDVYRVKGQWIENLVESTNFDDPESLQYFQRLIRKKGVIDALEKAGVNEGDMVALHDLEFEFIL